MLDNKKQVFFLTGASGVGKTTLVEKIKEKYSKNDNWNFLHFDSIGVPSLEEMTKEYGSPSEWQKAMTFKWIQKILNEYNNEVIIFEGQVNLDFIKEAFEKYSFGDYKIVLIDCNAEIMAERLTKERNQPELVNDDMRNWLAFLRKQAKDNGVLILDTSELGKEEIVKEFEEKVLKKVSLLIS